MKTQRTLVIVDLIGNILKHLPVLIEASPNQVSCNLISYWWLYFLHSRLQMKVMNILNTFLNMLNNVYNWLVKAY